MFLDEVPTVVERYASFRTGVLPVVDHLSFRMLCTDVWNRILVPQYYDPEIHEALRQLDTTHDLLSIGSLVEDGVLSIETGIEIG